MGDQQQGEGTGVTPSNDQLIDVPIPENFSSLLKYLDRGDLQEIAKEVGRSYSYVRHIIHGRSKRTDFRVIELVMSRAQHNIELMKKYQRFTSENSPHETK